MSEPEKPCVRGCRKPCSCPACADQPIHDAKPRPATVGYLCARCEKSLATMLRDVVLWYATLDPTLTTTDDSEGGKHRKVSGSPALSRLDVLALQDARTRPGVAMTRTARYLDDPDAKIDREMGAETITHAPTVLLQWQTCLADDLFPDEPEKRYEDTMTGAVRFMRTWWSQLCASPWVDEMWAEVKELRASLARAHGIRGPQPIGRCLTVECGHMLYAKPGDGAKVRCSECGRRYDGIGMLKVRIQSEREASA